MCIHAYIYTYKLIYSKEAKAEFPSPLTGPYCLEGKAVAERLAASGNYKSGERKPCWQKPCWQTLPHLLSGAPRVLAPTYPCNPCTCTSSQVLVNCHTR